jgi:hypothetical protein
MAAFNNHPTFLSALICLLSLLPLASAGFRFEVAPRATTPTTTAATCLQYSSVANYSTIGTNATYRAAFIQASPAGTDASTSILDGATAQLPQFQFDSAVNQECGNLTAVAIRGAALNFTQNVVADFKISAAAGGPSGGLGAVMISMMLASVGLVLV